MTTTRNKGTVAYVVSSLASACVCFKGEQSKTAIINTTHHGLDLVELAVRILQNLEKIPGIGWRPWLLHKMMQGK